MSYITGCFRHRLLLIYFLLSASDISVVSVRTPLFHFLELMAKAGLGGSSGAEPGLSLLGGVRAGVHLHGRVAVRIGDLCENMCIPVAVGRDGSWFMFRNAYVYGKVCTGPRHSADSD